MWDNTKSKPRVPPITPHGSLPLYFTLQYSFLHLTKASIHVIHQKTKASMSHIYPKKKIRHPCPMQQFVNCVIQFQIKTVFYSPKKKQQKNQNRVFFIIISFNYFLFPLFTTSELFLTNKQTMNNTLYANRAFKCIIYNIFKSAE